jgi:hypothetical protein
MSRATETTSAASSTTSRPNRRGPHQHGERREHDDRVPAAHLEAVPPQLVEQQRQRQRRRPEAEAQPGVVVRRSRGHPASVAPVRARRAGSVRRSPAAALLQERVDALLTVRRGRQRGDRRGLDRELVGQIGLRGAVEQPLDRRVGARRARRQAADERFRLGVELGVGHRPGDQADALGLLGADAPVGEHDLRGAPPADEPRQEPGGAAVGREADARVGHRERCRRAGQREVGGHDQREARPRRRALHAGDDRRVEAGELQQRLVQGPGQVGQRGARVVLRGHPPEVPARAEQPPLGGDEHRPGVAAGAQGGRVLAQLPRPREVDRSRDVEDGDAVAAAGQRNGSHSLSLCGLVSKT